MGKRGLQRETGLERAERASVAQRSWFPQRQLWSHQEISCFLSSFAASGVKFEAVLEVLLREEHGVQCLARKGEQAPS